MSKQKFIISGGGTGGHIFPAVAIANALKKKYEGCEILFVGANGRMEMEKVPQAGFEIKGLNIAGFQRGSLLKNLKLPFQLFSSLMEARNIVKSFQPLAAIGVGGYASGPLLFAAAMSGVPCLIQEQNSFAGVTNKILARFAKRICVAYEGMERVFPKGKIVLTGNPVRAEILNKQVNLNEAYQYFGLDASKKTLLIIGGSLGARTINESVDTHLLTTVNANGDVQILWQTGKAWSKPITSANGVKQLPFIDRMDYAYAIADVIISRAGALSIAELQNMGKPVLLVPSPNVAEDHQTHNAMALVEKEAALFVRDSDAKDMLMEAAFRLMKDEELQKKLRENIAKMAIDNAAERIIAEVERIV